MWGWRRKDQGLADAREEATVDVRDRIIEWMVPELPDVYADPALLKQVLVNLLSNSVKYTRDRVIARIEVGAAIADPADEVVVFVRDEARLPRASSSAS